MRELSIPPIARDDPSARELIRVWAARGKQHVSLATGLWEDPGAWGLLLVDLARHAARAYEQLGAYDQEQALARIREALNAEWDYPTDTPEGSVQD